VTAPTLAGKTALITGGLGGIGRETARLFHAEGATVAISVLPGADAPGALAEMERACPGLVAVLLDLRDAASITACLAEADARLGGIDILVNNAAVGSATVAGLADGAGPQDSAMLAINADGTLKMCQGFLAQAATDPDRVRKLINLSSVGGGIAAFPGFCLSDGMSKAAIAHLTRQLAAECVHGTVDVFAVCPGATDTPMFEASTLASLSPSGRAAFLDRLPKRRLIGPDEVARLILFLASDVSTLLHGAVIDASMGLGVRPGLLTDG
jgi:NAD(P)-dependent dehydrogenase (short-subunit alcohol dehydrogenase family)